ncbi:LOW QUALITY PROTEIN: DIS3-like exonuclease 1 [Gigantopelta aegis]|uniref:LOW QUALITY PROTEIN: DIS3-like exonuclease 1 n=1 Tax=Gigantopelta aegis TaxID=1735272 RepID=UPI001B88746C|nr:LOW QUALITY PROTEIN: DIS3-like exonuclease 1 [Gigantopelta aegis]
MVLGPGIEKTERQLRVKSRQGTRMRVVRELYLRDDVPCGSPRCLADCRPYSDKLCKLPDDVTHYLVPDCQVARDYLEILEAPEVQGIILTQTAVNFVQFEGSKRLFMRLKDLVNDQRKGSVIFNNEFQKYAYCEREPGEAFNEWQCRSTYQTCLWYYNHLAGQIPVVMVTQSEQAVKEYSNKTLNVFVMPMKDYLNSFWSTLTGIIDLYDSLSAALKTKNKERDYAGYLPVDVLEAGVKSGRFIRGTLNVNKHSAMMEAFVKRSESDLKDETDSDVLISGQSSRNRAVHGDLVVVEVLPRSQWRGRSMDIKQEEDTSGVKSEDAVSHEEDVGVKVMPTGVVVGILQRNWRDYVVSFAADQGSQMNTNLAGKVIVIPWDYRTPKIRISTRQVESLRDQRFIVRIDSWGVDSQYPNGHFVRSLGKIGDLETEIAALLVENDISVPPFTDGQLKELPADTPDNPWHMADEEICSRCDLRDSHLIFSIDPKGCEDVDDTLSVRKLPNGNYELGVHIADVTHFVKPGSLSDMEARSRATSVYLADRRYDMLPAVLSANLCSLVSGVDRYAVSVIWEISPNYEVLQVQYKRSVIRSQYKLYYELAQAIHDGMSDTEVISNIPELANLSTDKQQQRVADLRWSVCKLMEIARGLKSRRVASGALELESSEVTVEMDDKNQIEDLTPKDHMEIHDTIAECMIFANHWVARKIVETFPNHALLRHHPLPREDHFSNLINCAAARGYSIDVTSNRALAKSLDQCVDPTDSVVNKLLRSLATQAMSNAAYFSTGSLSRDQFFHYGLALDLYTHFTSPIRRYADIIVHRQLLAAMQIDELTGLPNNKEVHELSNHINIKHRAAQNAQRDSQELFQSLFFRDKSPDDETCVVDAVIFQLRTNGMLVYIPRYGIKGPVYLRDKEGLVVFLLDRCTPEWTTGQLDRTDRDITVSCQYGSQSYSLFDHITVRISELTSRSHSSCLKFELLSNKPHFEESSDSQPTSKSSKTDIITEVRSAAQEKQLELPSFDLGPKFPALKAEYGQTAEELSMYTVFESFKQIGLTAT